MKIDRLELEGVAIVTLDENVDARGSFVRLWDRATFTALGLENEYAQVSVVTNSVAGTIRGLHFQKAPAMEAKVVHCVRGAVYDVVVDLRKASATYGRHLAVQLSSQRRQALFVPMGFAHGYQTLADNTELLYQISVPYNPALASGVRFDDPVLQIAWPSPVTAISDRDLNLPRLGESG